MTWLLYGFGVYLAACYVWALYLAVRLYTGKRLRVLLFGGRHAAHSEPLHESAGHKAQTAVQTPPHRRAA